MIYKTEIPSPLGTLTLAADAEGLCGLWLPAQKQFTDALLKEVERKDNLPVFARTRAWLDRYFKGKAPSPDELPLHPVGTAFQQRYHLTPGALRRKASARSAVPEEISLDCDITVFYGTDDVLMQNVDMNSWQRYTLGKCETIPFSGGHFYYTQHKEEICQIIKNKLGI